MVSWADTNHHTKHWHHFSHFCRLMVDLWVHSNQYNFRLLQSAKTIPRFQNTQKRTIFHSEVKKLSGRGNKNQYTIFHSSKTILGRGHPTHSVSQISRLRRSTTHPLICFSNNCPDGVKAPEFYHITHILHSLHWLKITERIEYKVLLLTYKVLTTAQPYYLLHLITVQPHRSTHSSSVVTLSRPPSSSSLRITDRSFRYASPRLWNQLPASLRQPRAGLSILDSDLPTHTSSALSLNSPLSSSIIPSLFHSQLKTYLFHKSFPPQVLSFSRTDTTDTGCSPFFLHFRFCFGCVW